MYAKNAHSKYTSVQISTIDRGRLLLMMYDGCIKFLKHAKDGLENKDIVKFARFLSKAQAIIAELMKTLDFESGGQVAEDLDRLYDFMLFYLTEANLQKDASKVGRTIKLLETIASAYREIVESGKYADELNDILKEEQSQVKYKPAPQTEKKEEKPPTLSVSF